MSEIRWSATTLLLALTTTSTAGAQVSVVDIQRLTGSDSAEGDNFGGSVALDGDTLLVGAIGHDAAGNNAGAVYVFELAGGAFDETQKLLPSWGPFGGYGLSVALHGDRAAVGSTSDLADTWMRNGADFQLDLFLPTPDCPDEQTYEAYSSSSSMSSTVLAFGAPVSADYGGAYIFGLVEGAWTFQGCPSYIFFQPWPTDFGASVAATEEHVALTSSSGVHVYRRQGTGWPFQELLPSGGRVALDGHTLVSGDRVYVYDGTSWMLEDTLIPSRGTPDGFPWLPVIDGERIAVGVPLDDTLGVNTGSVLLFERQGTSWSQVATLVSSAPQANEFFGASVSIRGDLIAVGASGATQQARGFVEVFRVVSSPGFCDAGDGSLASCPCGPGSPDTGCDLASATGGVRLDVAAQETAPLNRLTLEGHGLAQMGAPAVLAIRSAVLEPQAVVFGDGLRCLGLPVVRLKAAFASGGSVSIPVMHGPMSGAGTFGYQLWFRDLPAMFCTPAGFNLSSGRQLTW